MKLVKREVQYFQEDRGSLYCIQDGDAYVFCLAGYSWSFCVKDAEELERSQQFMSLGNTFQDLRDEMIGQMKSMIEELSNEERDDLKNSR